MARRTLGVLIIDDEPVARRVLAEELQDIDDVSVLGEAADGDSALAAISQLSPDLLLLDVQMPGMDGFAVLRNYSGPLPAVIFVTAYSEHALRAFEVGAADYLLKPVRAERLRHAVERVRAGGGGTRTAEGLAKTLYAAEEEGLGRRPKIVARRRHDYFLLDLDEVYAFQAEGEIVWILTDNGKYEATHTLQALEQRLAGSQFQRVHRGVIVNTDKIRRMSALSSQRWLLTLLNGLEFTVSKRMAPQVREILR